ncbi:MAG: NTP/NDP exchange transporter [Hyphomicrobium sp.]
MNTINGKSATAGHGVLARLVAVKSSEVAALIASFTMFFTLLAAYYIVRPVRDEMGVTVGRDSIHHLFTIVFLVMLCAVPAFGWVASRVSRRLVLPALYGAFALALAAFWLTFRLTGADTMTAGAFFVFASVFNLFVVSLFWSLMSELWSHEEAKRLYGFIAAGGSAGALAGPLLTQGLVRVLPPIDLLLVSVALLLVSMAMSLLLRRLHRPLHDHQDSAVGGGILDGAVKVFTSPYFTRIALFIFLANVVGTFFYMEQSRLVGATIPDSAARVAFFSARDLVVSVVTIAIQIFGTAAFMNRLGVTGALVALPMTATAGTLALVYDPVLSVVAAVMVAERVVAFALSNPAVKVLYTLAGSDEKYKVQNFVDTVVYRGGDALSGWMYAFASGGNGFASLVMPLMCVPLTLLWIVNAVGLGRAHDARSAADDAREIESTAAAK